MAEIGLAKRQKTVRQKGKIRTDTNHPISFQGEALRMQEKPPNHRRTAEALMQDSGDRKKKKGFAGEETMKVDLIAKML